MKRAFTLIELLVVIGIMGLLGTISVGGYQAMQRGMEDRGALQTVNTLVKAAYARAQIDRSPTAIYYWNETIRSESEDENAVVVGHAVAVRRMGRITGLPESTLLLDEFADLNHSYATYDASGSGNGNGDKNANGGGGEDDKQNTMYLYCLDKLSNNRISRSVVSSKVESYELTEKYLQTYPGLPTDNAGSGRMTVWGFRVEQPGDAQWKVGSIYGLEFAEITLPHNYIFGSQFSRRVDTPIEGEGAMVFKVGVNTGSGAVGQTSSRVQIYALRPDGSGGLKAKQVGTTENPAQSNN